MISSSSWSKVPFKRPSPQTKWQNTIDFHWVHMLTGWQLGTVDVTRGAAEGCKNNEFFFHLEKSQLPLNRSFSDFRNGDLFPFLYQTTILSQLVILDWSSPLISINDKLQHLSTGSGKYARCSGQAGLSNMRYVVCVVGGSGHITECHWNLFYTIICGVLFLASNSMFRAWGVMFTGMIFV